MKNYCTGATSAAGEDSHFTIEDYAVEIEGVCASVCGRE